MNFKKYVLLLSLVCLSCKDKSIPYNKGVDPLFTTIPAQHSNIDFENRIVESIDFNFLNYSYIYNGGGVAIGDINNDGLEDIYFTSNQDSNRLYLNQGNFSFEDITQSAGVVDSNGWSTGVTMVDINNDGWLDIYVCKSGSINNRKARQNKLFINQKNNTFKEEALKYGLKEFSFSTQAYFLDYDKDGDLDMYLVNHSLETNKALYMDPQNLPSITKDDIDRLFRNDNGTFKDVTRTAGISLQKAWGLSASIGDFNNDLWPDIYVANDFFEPDFLYINNKDGTFTNTVLEAFKHISNNSMGSDFADINNDLLPDLIVLDMMASDRKRGKENMASMNTAQFDRMVKKGWHHQYMSNMLQLNTGNGSFSDIGQFSGIAKTDWSWAPLIADFNNDGYNDLFITNGIEKDLANQDFRTTMLKKYQGLSKAQKFEAAKKLIPSAKLPNYMFLNNADYTFQDLSSNLGFSAELNSNGAAYADLDNDGDLDLVLNNQSDKASLYRNNSSSNYLKVHLKGSEHNKNGLGARIEVYTDQTSQFKESYVSRGYQSSVSFDLVFGLGSAETIDSVKIRWSDNKYQTLKSLKANQTLSLNYTDARKKTMAEQNSGPFLKFKSVEDLGIDYRHSSVNFNDYALQLLLPQKQSEIDNALSVADVNKDGLDDIFIGNTAGYPSELYLQTRTGTFIKTNQKVFEGHKYFTDNNALFFDADSDGDQDLYVASGNYGLDETSPLLQDRLYYNDGKGNFSIGRLPEILGVTKAVTAGDFDDDGDMDLFVGGRVIPGKYPQAPESFLLENRSGVFVNVTSKKAEALTRVGLVNDAVFSDYDNDGDPDLLVVGEWMPITIFINNDGQFIKDKTGTTLAKSGWFQCIKAIDYDNDGDDDYFVGNFGENNKFHPTNKKPLHIYANYFDENDSYDIALSKESDGALFPVRGKECSSQQTPFLNEKIGTYKEFANSNIFDVYGQENIDTALHLEATTFSTYYIENKGGGDLGFTRLPQEAQFGPTTDFEFFDLNEDNKPEVIGLGGIYHAEVETIRYDASNGYIVTEQDSSFQSYKELISLTARESRAIEHIVINEKPHLLIMQVNDVLSLIELK